jgi:hypothetical protein
VVWEGSPCLYLTQLMNGRQVKSQSEVHLSRERSTSTLTVTRCSFALNTQSAA